MTGILNALIAGVSGAVKDAYFNLVSLLLPGNGTNGKQNNAFLDSSGQNGGAGWTITPNGNTTQGTFSPFSQTGWGAYFPANSYISIPSNTAFALGTGDFTIEAWVYMLDTTNSLRIICNAGTTISYQVEILTNQKLNFWNGSANQTFTGTNDTVPLNQWVHVAVTRSGTNLRAYINGSQAGTTLSSSANLANTAALNFPATNTYGGASCYLGPLRLVKGTALYTGSTLTLPTGPFTAVSGTSLIVCQSNRFIDNSGIGSTITTSGSVAITPFSPFAPTQSYSAAAVGGSGYFDGTGDYLSIADNTSFTMGTGDFTVEAWVYCTATDFASSRYIVAQRNASADTSISFAMNFIGGGFRKVRLLCFDSGGSSYEAVCATDVLNLNEWTHIAGVRNGATLRIYVNGVQQGTANISTASLVDSDGSVAIGRLGDANAAYWLGYISGLRITKGGCLYPSGTTFTPPTTPPTTTVSSGTVSLLTNFTNAGVVDATAKNVLETVGNAQISTTQSKWGGGSMYFDGTANTGLKSPTGNLNLFNFGTGAFTIEFWARFNSVATDQMVFGLTGSPIVFAFYTPSSGTLAYYLSSNGSAWDIASGVSVGSISTGQWYRVALVRSGNTFTPYLNTTAGTPTNSSAALAATGSGTILHLGQSTTFGSNFSGYLDDVRVTRGVARDMTVLPSAPFPVQ